MAAVCCGCNRLLLEMPGHAVSPSTSLPPLYAGWLTALLGGEIPAEEEATCDDCAMCPPANSAASASPLTFFSPETKCCTYQPSLANFLVGRILSDTTKDGQFGRATVEARMQAGVGVTPLGVKCPPTYALLYQHGSTRGFGHSHSMRCPHYIVEGGRCGVWRHRSAVCATWFCKHVRGAVGRHFWSMLYRLLTAIENDLAWWCVLELGIGRNLERLLTPLEQRSGIELSAADLDQTTDVASYRSLWADWAGREAAFYTECSRRVSALKWDEVKTIVGPETQALATLAERAYQELLDTTLPARLKLGSFRILHSDRSMTQIATYSGNDPLAVPTEAVPSLALFDGRPRQQVIRQIEREHHIRLTDGFLRKLTDFNVLTPVDDGFAK